ncbi:unnamed protein product [Musa acuminata subsp. malaccensis]|uniref:(wild Malaysian banana) hypothetical protein n=1 Tax=Musa acuminata subsp. malaccensis TaxID=214687 RepID=A0A804I3M9_MUSAM|nr:unnamed protein product [Musa acuminata subsp. malaccensis]
MLARESHCTLSENMNRRLKMSLGLKALQHQEKKILEKCLCCFDDNSKTSGT